MSAEEILLVSKWKLNKVSKYVYQGILRNHSIKVTVNYAIGKVFLKYFIPNGYTLFIDDEKKGDRLKLRDLDNIFNSL